MRELLRPNRNLNSNVTASWCGQPNKFLRRHAPVPASVYSPHDSWNRVSLR